MINVKIEMQHMHLSMHGHADAEKNDSGHDLVCCAASTLILTLLHSTRGTAEIDGSLDKGEADIRLHPHAGQGFSCLHKLEMTVDGLRMLAAKYPEHISV